MQTPTHRSRTGSLLVMLAFSCTQIAAQGGLIVNEISQGPNFFKEYAELVVVGEPCTTVDLRGWIVDDNNGVFTDCGANPDDGALAGYGIAAGHVRFTNDAVWAEVPVGTIILLYAFDPNNPDAQALIGGLAPDYSDANCDLVRVCPINSENPYMERDLSLPNGPDLGTPCPTNRTCPNGSTGNPNYNPFFGVPLNDQSFNGPFGGPLGLRNEGDGFQTRPPNGIFFHGFSYGTPNGNCLTNPPPFNGGPDGIHINDSGSNKNYFFTNLTNDDYRNPANFTSGIASVLGTPGQPNNCDNARWIASLRRPPESALSACNNPTVPPISLCVGESAVLNLPPSTGSCTSDSYSWSFSGSGNLNILAGGSGTSLTVEGTAPGSVTVTLTATISNDLLYTQGGCSGPPFPESLDYSFPLTITAASTANLGTATLCADAPLYDLTNLQDPNFPNGTWSGPGVNGNQLDPTGLSGEVTLTFTPNEACTVPATTTITLNEPPFYDNLSFSCDPNDPFYTVSFSISGGDPLTYSVNGQVLGASTFISDPIASGATYSFELTDGNNCGPVLISGSFSCICTTQSGTMDLAAGPLSFCWGNSFDISDYFLNNQQLGIGDVLQFALHDSPGGNLGNLIAWSADGFFDFPLTVNPGDTYFISPVAGANDGTGNINLDDFCLSVSPGIAVSFYEITLSTSGPAAICANECLDWNLSFTGTPPFQFQGLISNGSSSIPINHTLFQTDTLLSICPADLGITNGFLTLTPLLLEDENCTAVLDPTAVLSVEILPLPQGELTQVLGEGESIVINGTLYDEDNPHGTEVLPGAAINGCDSFLLINLSFTTALQLSAEGFSPTCDGYSDGSVWVEAVSGGKPPYFLSLDATNFMPIDSLPFQVNNLPAGSYDLILQDAEGNQTTWPVFVPFAPLLDIQLGEDESLILGEDYSLDPQVNFAVESISWSPSTYLSCVDCLNPTVVQPLEGITYEVTVFDAQGCAASDNIRLLISQSRQVYLPNGFSPDFNGVNDHFLIFGGAEIANISAFRVFDRWGNLLFQASNFPPNDPAYGWDGTFRGKSMDSGMYVYYAEVVFIDGYREVFKGEVTLIR